MEDPVDSVAESNQQLHGFESTPKEGTLNWRDVSSSYGRCIASSHPERRSLRESHATSRSLYGIATRPNGISRTSSSPGGVVRSATVTSPSRRRPATSLILSAMPVGQLSESLTVDLVSSSHGHFDRGERP